MSILTGKAASKAKWQSLAPIVFLGIWPFIFYWPVTLGRQVFYANDIFRLFFPLQTELARALADGRLPLWTPYLQAGFPLFAEGEIAALYPINLIFHILFPVSSALSYSILFHLAWASVGMYILGRSAGLNASSALLGGFCFGFSGFVTAHLQHAPHIAVGSWLPWLVLFQQKYWLARLQHERSTPWFILSSLAIGIQLLGGFPQMALLNLGVFTLLGFFGPFIWSGRSDVFTVNQPRFDFSWFAQAAFSTLSSLIIGIGLAAIQLVPTAELLGFSIRGQDLGRDFFTSLSLDPSALTQFIFPFAQLGTPGIGNMEFWAYLGIMPLFLAILALLLRRTTQTWLFLLLALVSISLALGGSNPIYQWLYYVPVFNRLRVPARFIFPFTFAISFLAANGFQELQKRLRDSAVSVRVSTGMGVTIALGTVGAIGLGYWLPLELWMSDWNWLPILFVLLSGAAILAAWRHLLPLRVFQVVAAGLTIFDLTLFSIPFLDLNRTVAPSEAASIPRTVQSMDNSQSVYRSWSSVPPATGTSARAALWPNFSLQFARQGVDIYAPLEFQRAKEYIDAMTPAMMDLFNIRYYLLPLETLSPADPSPFNATEPSSGLSLGSLTQPVSIAPTRVTQIEVTCYTDQSQDLPNDFLAGQIVLGLDSGDSVTLPIRMGRETADWAYDALAEQGKVNHDKPNDSISFAAYLSSVGHAFSGHKYIARYAVTGSTPWIVRSIGVRSLLSNATLTIEHISLTVDGGKAVSLASLLHLNDLALVFRSHTAAMWENLSVMPRAFVVHHAETASDDRTLALLEQPDFQPDQVVLLNDATPAELADPGAQEAAADQVSIAEYKPESVVINVKASKPGYLVLTDSWYPGWTAAVDGKAEPIYRADYIFRAVALSEGQHSVVFEYKPASLVLGVTISALSLVFCIGLATASHLRPSFLN